MLIQVFSFLSGKRVDPIYKKGDKQTLKNYRPVSFLLICGKNLERLMFNEMFKCFIENERISCYTSRVLNQVRGVSLDISKPFDKEWHYGLIFKWTQNRISVNLLKPLRDFLSERRQRVVLNVQASTRTNITTGVP